MAASSALGTQGTSRGAVVFDEGAQQFAWTDGVDGSGVAATYAEARWYAMYPRLVAYIRKSLTSWLGPLSLMDDAIQEGALEVWRYLVADEGRARTVEDQILLMRAVQYAREKVAAVETQKAVARRSSSLGAEINQDVATPGDCFASVEQAANWAQIHDLLSACLDALPAQHRQLITDILAGVTQSEIARREGVTPAAVARRLARLRVHLAPVHAALHA